MTLFKRPLISSVAIVVLAVAVSTSVAIAGQTRALNDELIGKGELLASHVALSTRDAFTSLNLLSVERCIQDGATVEEVIFCKVVMPDGTVYLADDKDCYGEAIEPEILNAESFLIDRYVDPQTGRKGKLIVEPFEIGQETWWVLLALSSDRVKEAARSVLLTNLGAAVAILTIGITGALVLSRSISEPVVQLAEAAQAFGAGRLSHPVDTRAAGEVGVLARSFNEMIDRLRTSKRQLEEYSEGLEIGVRERTADLAQANEALREEIIERKRAEEALRASEAHLRAVFEAAVNVSFVTSDLSGEAHILDFGPGAERILGYSREEAIGLPVAQLHLVRDAAGCPKAIESMRLGQPGLSGETLMVRKSREAFPALLTTYPLLDASGDMTAMLRVYLDISDRRRAEEALRESEELFRNVF